MVQQLYTSFKVPCSPLGRADRIFGPPSLPSQPFHPKMASTRRLAAMNKMIGSIEDMPEVRWGALCSLPSPSTPDFIRGWTEGGARAAGSCHRVAEID